MTEDEAKKKWCHRAPRIFQTIDQAEHSMFCLGSGCMAWRWATFNSDGHASRAHSIRESEIDIQENNHPRVIGGYCGLAGKP